MNEDDVLSKIKSGNIQTNLSFLKKKSWPKCGYYFSNFDEVIQILAHPNEAKDLKLYFRPQSPFLNEVEGVRTKNNYIHKRAAKPVPIALLFNMSSIVNSKNYLILDHDGNQLELDELPFSDIYNDVQYSNLEQKKAYYSKWENLQLTLIGSLSIDLLDKIMVRSLAESNTLKQFIIDNDEISNDYLSSIFIDENGSFFSKRWSFIESVLMRPNSVDIITHLGEDASPYDWGDGMNYPLVSDSPNYIRCQIKLIDADGNEIWVKGKNGNIWLLKKWIHVDLERTNFKDFYYIKIYLNDQLAYYGLADGDSIFNGDNVLI